MIVRHDNKKKSYFTWKQRSYIWDFNPDSSGNLEFAIMDLAPNTSSCVDRITHNGDEIAYVLEGEVKLFMDDDEFTLSKEIV